MTPDITIILSTHNRCGVLSGVIRCVLAQTYTSWRLLVIGDACTDDTGSIVSAFDDDRISFVDLPERFGEQAGPNSVGMALAETSIVAFLNHDDYWLPDHLEVGLRHLKPGRDDFYWSRAAFFTNRGPRHDLPMFVETSPLGRSLEAVSDAPYYYCEPISTWMARRNALQRLGPMQLASKAAVRPVHEYCIRAYRMGCSLISGNKITVLKDNMRISRSMHISGASMYSQQFEAAEDWIRQIENHDVSTILSSIEEDLWLAHKLGLSRDYTEQTNEGLTTYRHLHHQTGIDLLALEGVASKNTAHSWLSAVLKSRTGEIMPSQPRLSDMIEFARGIV